MNVLFISSFAPIVTDRDATRRLYVDTFGLELEDADGYLHSEKVDGVRHFGLWPLEQAAEAHRALAARKTTGKVLLIPGTA